MIYGDALYHYGIKGQKKGKRRYQNPDGTLTPAGKIRHASAVASGLTTGAVLGYEARQYGKSAKELLDTAKTIRKFNRGMERTHDSINKATAESFARRIKFSQKHDKAKAERIKKEARDWFNKVKNQKMQRTMDRNSSTRETIRLARKHKNIAKALGIASVGFLGGTAAYIGAKHIRKKLKQKKGANKNVRSK